MRILNRQEKLLQAAVECVTDRSLEMSKRRYASVADLTLTWGRAWDKVYATLSISFPHILNSPTPFSFRHIVQVP